jgi:hypothetical protein
MSLLTDTIYLFYYDFVHEVHKYTSYYVVQIKSIMIYHTIVNLSDSCNGYLCTEKKNENVVWRKLNGDGPI